ncbi:MAG: aminoacyl-histidine dipeptidase [Clostridia bacterium]|nr:aminoacyl-histidine dipeptidase [Clostridia bacterium]NCC44805.1 aminoacyl-histidine dipeptidase [Clostridia bacterium]
MAVLSELKPEKVFYYFEELCKIPHGSGNTKGVSDYLVSFAKEHELTSYQDDSNNVVIYKAASVGYEDAPVTILQGHCDMVAEKTPESTHDFEKDGLELMIEEDFISAKDTTLGGDDGIAVAYMLAILDDDSLKHPALECVITTDEEIGLLGAKALDTSVLKGKYLINMDSEEEGYLWISCAGGLSGISRIPVAYHTTTGETVEVVIDGLTGGHSGAEIDKIRANSNKLAGRFLYELNHTMEFELAGIEGGTKDNAITRKTVITLVVSPEDLDNLKDYAAKYQKDLRKEYSSSDTGICITINNIGEKEIDVLDMVSKEKVKFFLMNVPYGIEKMSGEIEGLVETSNNIGILRLEADSLFASCGVRSSVGSAKLYVSEKIQYLTEFLGGEYSIEGDYPAWEYKKDSKLRDLMVQSYKEIFGEEPCVKAIHAGLECGLFYDTIPGLDCVSFGPTMKDIHTTEEKLSISSTARMWDYLVKTLENINA